MKESNVRGTILSTSIGRRVSQLTNLMIVSQKKDSKKKMAPVEENISPFLEEDQQERESWECDDVSDSSSVSSMISSLTGTHSRTMRKNRVERIDEEKSDDVEKGSEDPLASSTARTDPTAEVSQKESNGGLKAIVKALSFGKGDGNRSIKASAVQRSRRFYLIWGTVFLCVLAGVIALAVVLSTPNGSQSNANVEDDNNAQLNPREKALLEIFKNVSMSGLYDQDSPQYKAREFIIQSDTLKLTPSEGVSSSRIAQRYALAVFYFSTNGPVTWAENNWLVGSECENLYWIGISCNEDDEVRAIAFDDYGLQGTLPEELGALTMLENLIVKNHPLLSGPIPLSLGKLRILGQLGLYNNALTGGIPHELYDATKLNYLNLQNNQLEGDLILRIENLHNLEKLILFNNKFSGGVPLSQLSRTGIRYLGLSNNKFSGSLVDQIGVLYNLEHLYLDNNALTGKIPKTIGGLTNLISLNLDMNYMTGSIPSTIGVINRLEYFSAQNNTLLGRIPSEIANLGQLVVINVGTNALTGNVPDLSKLRYLKQLHLFQNELTGTLPSWIAHSSSLEVLFLSSNKFTGSLAPILGDTLVENLQGLYISDNDLAGSLPTGLCALTNLKALFLDANNFTKGIPECFGNLSDLRQLYLFSNSLSGQVPMQLSKLTKLSGFGIEDNDLRGSIPSGVCAIKTLNEFWADCVGRTPEVLCTCCTTCCPSPKCE